MRIALSSEVPPVMVNATPLLTWSMLSKGSSSWAESATAKVDLPAPGGPECVIRRKTDTGSGAKRTAFRSYPDKVPAESGHL